MPSIDLFERCGDGVYSLVKGAGLLQADGKTPVSAYKMTLPSKSAINYPCSITSWEEGTEEEELTFESQLIVYPIHVILADRQPGEDESWRPLFLGWRKQLQDIFRPLTTLPNVPECWDIRLVNLPAIPAALFNEQEYEAVVSGFTVRVFTTEDWDQHP